MDFAVASDRSVLALSLWNGAGNNPAPVGWFEPGYDDYSWPIAEIAELASFESAVSGSQPIWSFTLPLSTTDITLFRQHFTLTGPVAAASIVLAVDDYLEALYLNGTPLSATAGSEAPGAAFSIPTSLFINGQNVLALQVRNASGPPTNNAFVSYLLNGTISTVDSTGTIGPGAGSVSAGSTAWGTELCNAVRLRHNPDMLDWEHDGTLFRVRSQNKTVLQTPFPVLSGPPAALLGRDPVSGLPMWTAQQAPPAPPPPPVTRTYHTPDRSLQDTTGAPDPLPTPPNAQRVCGAAYNMAALVCAIYDAVVQLINKAKSDIISDFTQTLKDSLQGEIVSLLTEAEFLQYEIDAVQIALTILANIVAVLLSWGTTLPTIAVPDPGVVGVSIFQVVRCAAFSALWLTGGDYFSEGQSADGLGTRDYWQQNMNADWSFFAGSTVPGVGPTNLPWQLQWLDDIVASVPDVAWSRAAWAGAQRPQTTCSTCSGYPS